MYPVWKYPVWNPSIIFKIAKEKREYTHLSFLPAKPDRRRLSSLLGLYTRKKQIIKQMNSTENRNHGVNVSMVRKIRDPLYRNVARFTQIEQTRWSNTSKIVRDLKNTRQPMRSLCCLHFCLNDNKILSNIKKQIMRKILLRSNISYSSKFSY